MPTSNGQPAVGTALGSPITFTAGSAPLMQAPFALTTYLLLTVGTTADYIDIAIEAVTGDTASIILVTATAVEI